MINDIAIIGGGINGIGLAVEAASRGLSVVLFEQDDLAQGTSSKSSKLAHGGLRYLEHQAYNLVKESLKERDNLIRNAPHLVHSIPFIIPIDKQARKEFLIRFGLFIYDFFNLRGETRRSKKIKLDTFDPNNPIKRSINKAFQYFDCTVDDARLVVTLARQAQDLGALILPQTKLIQAEYNDNQYWKLSALPKNASSITSYQSKVLINASGPWMLENLTDCIPVASQYQLRQIKGSHIILPKLYPENQAYLLQHIDGRVVFTIPYMEHFTLVGTTDTQYFGDLNQIQISKEEINYLCDIVNQYFHHPIKADQIVDSWAGVRALWDDNAVNPSNISRECKIESLISKDHPPLINIYGGKLTTYRSLAEKCIDGLDSIFTNLPASQTSKLKLPGCFEHESLNAFIADLSKRFNFLPGSLLRRYGKSYGLLSYEILQNCNQISDLGKDFGHGLHQVEVDYLMAKEWAKFPEDILWRRTKLGLFFKPDQIQFLQEYMDSQNSKILVRDQAVLEN